MVCLSYKVGNCQFLPSTHQQTLDAYSFLVTFRLRRSKRPLRHSYTVQYMYSILYVLQCNFEEYLVVYTLAVYLEIIFKPVHGLCCYDNIHEPEREMLASACTRSIAG